MSLKSKVISGVKWTSFSSLIIAVLQIFQISILTRYLSAEDFGLMAIVMVVIGFSNIFSDMGISNAIIHHQHTSPEQLSSLYWFNIFSGILLFFIFYILAPYIASFYDRPKLVDLLVLLASTFIISSMGNQYRVLFQKKLQFNTIAKIEILGAVGSFIVAISLAMNNFGVYALAYATVTSLLIANTLYFFYGIREHKPTLIYNYKEIKEYLNFGLFQMGDSTINYFNGYLDVLIIGKLLGVEAVGIYSIAKQLAMRPFQIINPIITKVAFPTMAKVQTDTEYLKSIYLKIINYLGSINFPIYALLILFSSEVVSILFGDQWQAVIPILKVLSLSMIIISIGNPLGSLLLATGKVKWGFFWNLLQLIAIPIIIYFASFGGLIIVAWSIVLTKLILIVPAWYFLLKPLLNVSLYSYLKVILIPAIITLFAFIIAYVLIKLITVKLLASIIVPILFIGVYLYISLKYNKVFIQGIVDIFRRKNYEKNY